MSNNNDPVHQLIQQRYKYITDQLRNNDYYKQLYTVTGLKLTHLQHTHAYEHVQTKLLPINSYIDHTVLKPNATATDIEQLCNEARAHNFASVCINSSRIVQCKDLLRSSPVTVCSVVGFPLGACTTQTKCHETKQAIADGATEIDMVINIGYLCDNNYNYAYNDIVDVVRTASGYTVKVILETCLLTPEQIIDATLLVVLSGAQFVKTSTGFSTSGATVEHIQLMKLITANSIEIKASGGIRDYSTANAMLQAGATRLGVSAGIAIVAGEQQANNTTAPAVQVSNNTATNTY